MKRPIQALFIPAGVLALVLMFSPLAPAYASGGVGIRFGVADVPAEVFRGSGDLGGTNLVGLHLSISPLPLIDLEVAGEYIKEEFSFKEGFFDGIEATGKGDYEDISLLATARFQLFSLILVPFDIYIGGGLNSHFVDLQIDESNAAEIVDPKANADDLEDAVKKVVGPRSEVGWHVVGGIRLSLPQSPLSIFAEARYLQGMTDDLPDSRSIYVGFSLGL